MREEQGIGDRELRGVLGDLAERSGGDGPAGGHLDEAHLDENHLDENHLDENRLGAYLAGELPAERAAAAQRHLAGCRRCLDLCLELAPLYGADEGTGEEADGVAEGGEDGPPPTDFERAADWRRLQAALKDRAVRPAAATDQDAPAAAAPPPVRIGWRAPLTLLAAALVLAVIGLALWVGALRQTVTEQERMLTAAVDGAVDGGPRLNLPVVYLESGALRSSGEEPPALELAQGEAAVLILTPEGGAEPGDRFRLEIAAADGAVVWRGDGLRASEYGTLRLALTRRQLPAGALTLRLVAEGEGGTGESPAGEVTLEVRHH